MSIECHHSNCPYHSYNNGNDEGPFCHEPECKIKANELDHFMNCLACGQAFDMREIEQVIHHQRPGHLPTWVNKK